MSDVIEHFNILNRVISSLPTEHIESGFSEPRSAMNHRHKSREPRKMKGPLVLLIISHIVCMSATLNGAVETLEVNKSTVRQLIKTVEETERSPILLLNRTPISFSYASSGNLRSSRPAEYSDQCNLQSMGRCCQCLYGHKI
jgi:hypothetical protein